MNKLCKKPVIGKLNYGSIPVFNQMQNIQTYLEICKKANCPTDFLFETTDLMEGKNFSKVLRHLNYLASLSSSCFEGENGPDLSHRIQQKLGERTTSRERSASFAPKVEVTNLDHDISLKKAQKHDYNLEKSVKEWIESATGELFPSGASFQESLKDGTLLCK